LNGIVRPDAITVAAMAFGSTDVPLDCCRRSPEPFGSLCQTHEERIIQDRVIVRLASRYHPLFFLTEIKRLIEQQVITPSMQGGFAFGA
jgi:hypothetical protein